MTETRGLSASVWAGIVVAVLALALPAPARAQDVELPVPKVTIYPGDVLTEEMLVERAFVARTVARATVYDSREALVGKVARRTLLPLQPIAIHSIRDPYVVNQGKVALVVYEAGGLIITSQATALQNGGVGDVVSLRNNDSGLVIKGTVAPDGSVRLGAP
jgi:flagella basal body P-ring formation protein FlgA